MGGCVQRAYGHGLSGSPGASMIERSGLCTRVKKLQELHPLSFAAVVDKIMIVVDSVSSCRALRRNPSRYINYRFYNSRELA